MGSIGLVIVSHSKNIAQGVVELISEVAKDVPITYVGGTEDGGIGTSFDQVDRVVSENPADTLLAFFDLGSAKMNLEMVADFSDKSIIINRVPIVEGAYTAAALLQTGAELSVIQTQLAELEISHHSKFILAEPRSKKANKVSAGFSETTLSTLIKTRSNSSIFVPPT